MTTIVYCHESKKIAIDSRSTVGITIESDRAEKFRRIGDEVWFFCGATADIDKLIKIHNEEMPAFNVGCSAMVANKDGVFIRMYDQDKSRYMPYKLIDSWTMGSGADHALTALDMGASAKKAVQMAMLRDTCTGGKIWVLDCIALEFDE